MTAAHANLTILEAETLAAFRARADIGGLLPADAVAALAAADGVTAGALAERVRRLIGKGCIVSVPSPGRAPRRLRLIGDDDPMFAAPPPDAARLNRPADVVFDIRTGVEVLPVRHWVAAAPAGSLLSYHRGSLARDCEFAPDLPPDQSRALCGVRAVVQAAAAAGAVRLAQRRIGAPDGGAGFEYLAVKAG